jgi:CXXX repeat peptide maturase
VIRYLIVILEYDSAPFCCYEINDRDRNETIPLDLLKRIVNFAIKNGVAINFLYGDTVLPPGYEKVIAEAEHMKMIPLRHARFHEDAIFIINSEKDLQYLDVLEKSDLNNLILRVSRDDLGSLCATVKRLIGKFKRLNVIVKDIGSFDGFSFSIYEDQLEDVRALIEREYSKGNFIEINILSDRVFLTNMNNCNAGTHHLTVAPNGKFYLCPAFYYENEDKNLGGFNDGIDIKNARLLELEYAPICRNCDAYHCKRCIYLNEKLTSELNTPSHQQCVIAHLERNASRKFLKNVRVHIDLSDRIPPIPKIDYLDPLDIITDRSLSGEEREKHFAELLSKPLENVPVQQLLRQIYITDPGMLTRLKALNCSIVDPKDKE